MFNNNYQSNSRLTKLIFAMTGSYQDQVYRPYHANYSDTNLQAQFVEATCQNTKITANKIAGIAGEIIKPNAIPQGSVVIPNGFGTQRLYFMMEVMHDDGARQVLSGYTSYADIGHSSLDPAMSMHFNQSITLRDHIHNGRTHTTQTDMSHLVGRPELTQQQIVGSTQQKPVKMRPADLVSSFDLLETHSMYAGDARDGFIDEKLVLENPVKSRISNGSAASYLTDVTNAYVNSSTPTDNEYGWQTRNSVASGNICESLLTADKFLASTTNFASRLLEGGEITWGELTRACPEAIELARASIEFMCSNRQKLANNTKQAGMSSGFNASTWEAVIDAQLRGSVPAIMCQYNLTRLKVIMQTCCVSQVQMTTGNMHGIMDPKTGSSCAVLDARGLSGQDVVSLTNMIEQALHSIALPEVSNNYQEQLNISIDMDIFGDSTIDISYRGNPAARFISPTFASALNLPIIGQSHQHVDGVIHDLHDICTQFNV